MSLTPGVRFDRYEIHSRIGAGGMGEVYLARDLRLGRQVALKLLLPRFSSSREHLRRFEQEARAASSLNHPNILTIYEISSVGETSFIAAEFVEGNTLRQLLANKSLGLAQALNVARQIASGLATAHEAGILHRDIKPENVMIRRDGYVKLLDFGLAKLTDTQPAVASDSESTLSEIQTNSGAVIGTTAYMSPEQLRGEVVDQRADIWSFGCVLYEMIAGRHPFEAESAADLIVAILQKDATPLLESVHSAPPAIASSVARMLSKDRGNRQQSFREVLIDLRNQELDSHDQSAPALGTALEPTELAPAGLRAQHERPKQNFTERKTLRHESVEPAFSWRKLALPAILVLALAGLVIGYVIYKQRAGRAVPSHAVRAATPIKLVETGNAVDAAISPDGKYLAYVTEEAGWQSLWGKQVAVASNVWAVVPKSNARFLGLTFSPDSNYILYIVFDDQINQYVLYRTPALGGVSEKVLNDVDTPVSFSPDGQQFTFVRGYPEKKQTVLVVANADGKNERIIATRQSPDDFGFKGGPSWSPDGELIACAVGRYNISMTLSAVRVTDGREAAIWDKSWPWIGRVAWIKDGSGLLIIARDQLSSPVQVWHVSYPDGLATRVSNDVSSYTEKGISVANSSSFVAVQNNYLSSIWVQGAGSSRPRRLASTRSDGYRGLAFLPDGRIVFASNASGSQDLWVMDGNGENRIQLTSGGSANFHPSPTRDGNYVVFVSTRSGQQDLWRLDMKSRELKQLTFGAVADFPNCSPDGRWVVYKSFASGRKTIWRVGIDGLNQTQITDRYSDWPAVSPDGQLIAIEYWDEQPTTQALIAILPWQGGTPIKTFNFARVTANAFSLPGNLIRWSQGGRAVAYIDGQNGVSNVMEQSLAGSPPKQITNFDSDLTFWFDWSSDGRTLATSRGSVTGDVVLFALEKQ